MGGKKTVNGKMNHSSNRNGINRQSEPRTRCTVIQTNSERAHLCDIIRRNGPATRFKNMLNRTYGTYLLNIIKRTVGSVQWVTTERSSRSNETSTDKDIRDRDTLFPCYLIWLIFATTVTFRLWYVSKPSNWWVLHPDEIYQTIEVAHSEVYGYGFRPYEYLPPPGFNAINVTSELRESEINKGMYSMRSFLLPKLLSIVMSAGRVVAPSMSPYLVIKLVHVVLTSVLPLSVYVFSLAHHGSRDIALMAAIFVSSSTTLNVFGTHTLSNSFVAPVLFFSLVPLITVLTSKVKRTENHTIHQKRNHSTATASFGESPMYTNSVVRVKNGHLNRYGQCSLNHTNGHVQQSTRIYKNEDVNGNVVKHASNHCDKDTSQSGTSQLCSNNHSMTNGYITDRNSCLNGGHLRIGNGTAPIKDGTIRHSSQRHARQQRSPTFNDVRSYTSGIFLALCIYVRLDCAIIPAACVFAIHPKFIFDLKSLTNELIVYIIGFVTGILIGGIDDYVMYNSWFLSPIQWFRFNVWQDGSSKVFGSMPVLFYIERLLVLEPWVMVVLTVFAIYVIVSRKSFKYVSFIGYQNQNCAMSVVLAILLSFYSLSGHKEYRFFHNALVFMYIAFSQASFYIINFISRKIKTNSFRTYFIYLFITSFVSSHIYQFMHVEGSSLSLWSYGKSTRSHEVNACLDFIRQRNDVKGVYVDFDFHSFGGFSILHRNVPVMAYNGYDIYEYSTTDRWYSGSKSLALFWRISELISDLNTPYLIKYLIRHREYNYVVFPSDGHFIDIGYQKVFSCGTMTVLRRTFHVQDERVLWERAESIPIGTNATVMEYEGYWLQRFGQLAKAERRLLISNRLDPRRLGPFQILRHLFHSKGNETVNENNVIKACLQVHTHRECHSSYAPVTLYVGSN